MKKNETTSKNGLTLKEDAGYMMGDAGNLFVLTYISSFLKVFYTDVLKIAPQKIANLFFGHKTVGRDKRPDVGKYHFKTQARYSRKIPSLYKNACHSACAERAYLFL